MVSQCHGDPAWLGLLVGIVSGYELGAVAVLAGDTQGLAALKGVWDAAGLSQTPTGCRAFGAQSSCRASELLI